MSRAAVYSLLVGDTQLSALGITASTVYSGNTVDALPVNKPAVILAWGPTFTRWEMAGKKGKQLLTVWAHDHGGSYERINLILDRVKEILESSFHIIGADGLIMTQADYRGESDDLQDDGLKTLTRNSAWEIITRKAT